MEDFRRLLSSLEWGQNFKWFNGKKKLPNSGDGNIYEFDVDDGGLSVEAVKEICTKMKGQNGDMLIVATDTKEHKSSCKCDGCPVGSVEQFFVGYREENAHIVQTVVKVTWTKEMCGYDHRFGYDYDIIERSIFEVLSNNENLLFTVGSNFGYTIIADSL